ncbi:11285_t:CDS:1, partial [Gigaspora margarita]
ATDASELNIYEMTNNLQLSCTYSFCQIDNKANEVNEPNEVDKNNYINVEEFRSF